MPQYDNVYVRNLPMGVGQDMVRQIFGCYGEVVSCRVMTKEGMASATALVKFSDPACAQGAIDALNGGIPQLLQHQMDPNVGLVCKHAMTDDEKNKGGKGAGPPPGPGNRYSPYPAPQQQQQHQQYGAPAPGAPQSGGRFKTVLCKHFLTGTCTKGPGCSFAHGDHEIQRNQGGGQRRAGAPPAYGGGGKGGGGGYGGYAAPQQAAPVQVHAPPQPKSSRLSGTEQIEYLKSYNHPLLGSLRDAMTQGEEDTLLTISEIPHWMDESGLYLLFAPYGAVNMCQLDPTGTHATLRYVHQRAAQNAVSHLNGLRIDATCKPLTVVHAAQH
eukprot:TRINITY_DN601_c0_g1_i1.p1 TRINITY_DN601_c0_g1~~TRINITY_DN601_c0_g1_i1.p1  ORF type:complete len:327 (+),score=111.67 TRINITY_DN601_c0_g1_i1:47-1027(+)